MKYVKAGDPAPTPEQLEKIKAEAIVQLDQYSADPALIAEWHIGAAAGSDKSVASPKGTTLGEAALSPRRGRRSGKRRSRRFTTVRLFRALRSTASSSCSTAASAY